MELCQLRTHSTRAAAYRYGQFHFGSEGKLTLKKLVANIQVPLSSGLRMCYGFVIVNDTVMFAKGMYIMIHNIE